MKTEEEAKKCWCPMGRAEIHYIQASQPNVAYFTLPPKEGEVKHPHCIASACMTWRWEERTATLDRRDATGSPVKAGYCGLAGKP